MIEKVEGIVVNEKNYGDTSKIIDIFTKEHGIIGVIAKGAKGIKSKLRSTTDKLSYGEFTIYYKENKLSLLKEVHILNSLKNIRKDIILIGYSSFLLDLSTQVWKHSFNDNVYSILINSLLKINEGFDALIITNIVELKYLDYLGVMPSLTGCVVCGSNQVVTLSSDKGGYLCSKCRINEPIISDKTMKLIRMYYYVDIAKIDKINISDNIKKQINNFLDEYYEKYTGLYLKSKKFLKEII